MSYQNVLDALEQHNLSWNDIDRILLYPDTYEEFRERASFEPSNYSTSDVPAVRETVKDEKIVYVAENGMEVTINL